METTVIDNVREEHTQILEEMRLVPLAEGNLRKELFDHIKYSLIQHMEAEEATIYTRLSLDIANENCHLLVEKSLREHHQLREYLQRLNLINIKDKAWLEMFGDFTTALILHCNDEELTLFNELKEDFSKEELIDMGMSYVDVRALSSGPNNEATYV